jgi:hypothetical protein
MTFGEVFCLVPDAAASAERTTFAARPVRQCVAGNGPATRTPTPAARQKRGGAVPQDGAANRKGLRGQGPLRADRAVSTESLAMNAAPHQSEPGPPGLIGVDATPDAK